MCPCDDHDLCASSDRPFFEEKFGINKQLATKICVLAFENDIAKLTLEIAQPRILELVKDQRVTFPDMLGTIGEQINHWKSIFLHMHGTHRTRRGRRLDFGYQREFQHHMNSHGVGFQKI